jgi:hypothetical protein
VLQKNGLADGLEFRVEVLDTWNMSVTPVDGTFVTKKRDDYYFEDRNHRVVTLPGKAYIALRVRRAR